MTVTREDIVAALGKIVDPGQGKDLIAAGMAKAITVSGGKVSRMPGKLRRFQADP